MEPCISTATGQRDELVRTLASDGSVSVRAIVGGHLVERARQIHDLAPTATHALGRALLGVVLVAAGAKQGETVQLGLRGNGPLGSILAISDLSGRVRGHVQRPRTDLPARGGRPDVSRAIGDGVISVVRHHPHWRQPYTGITPLSNSEIASDIARYLTESEQTPSAVGLGVVLDRTGCVVAAGGFIVQAMPGADDATVGLVERNVRSILSPGELVRSGARGSDIADILLQGVGRRSLETSEPAYACPCSMERVTRAMLCLGRGELAQVIADEETLEVRCEFCAARYAVAPDDLRELLAAQ